MSEVSSKNHKFLYAPELNVRLLDSHVSTRPTYTTHIQHIHHTHIHRPKDAVAAIRKRLTSNSKNFHIVNLTLTVRMYTCVYYPHHKPNPHRTCVSVCTTPEPHSQATPLTQPGNKAKYSVGGTQPSSLIITTMAYLCMYNVFVLC